MRDFFRKYHLELLAVFLICLIPVSVSVSAMVSRRPKTTKEIHLSTPPVQEVLSVYGISGPAGEYVRPDYPGKCVITLTTADGRRWTARWELLPNP